MKTAIRLWTSACLLSMLAACAFAPPATIPSATDLFSDSTFRPPAQPVDTTALFALSEPMKTYMRSPYFAAAIRNGGKDHGLIDALYKKGELKLEYDAAATRDAAATFAARTGNCLSLVIMTAAFAREMGLEVNFRNVMVEQQWSRSGSMYFASTHVNMGIVARPEHLRT